MKLQLNKKSWWWSYLLAVIVAMCIRLPYFGQLPAGLNRDEAALGYNAYSLARTGRDEWGKSWPVSITSFGDQKLPGYVYSLVPLVAIGGPQPWLIRLPSLVAGLVNIGLFGWIVEKIRQTSGRKNGRAGIAALPDWLPLIAMLMLAISPWGNHFSRIAYEAHLAMMFFGLGAVSLWQAYTSTTTASQRRWLILSSVSWSASLLTYHTYHVYVPLVILLTAVVLWPWLSRRADRLGLGIGGAIGLGTLILMGLGGVWSANQIKMAGISPFASPVINSQIAQIRSALPGGDTIWAKLISNKFSETAAVIIRHLLDATASSFYFTSTTAHHIHNVTGIGNLHWWLAPFIVIGLAWLWQNYRRHPLILWLVGCLLAALVAPAITITPQHTIRISPIFPWLEIVAAVGLAQVWQQLPTRRWWRMLLAAGFGLMVVFSTLRFVVRYYYVSPRQDSAYSQLRYHHLVQLLNKYQATGQTIITNQPSSSPYIWYLVLNKFDPRQLATARETYPVDAEGFQHVRRLNNIYFVNFDWPELEKQAATAPLLVIAQARDIPTDKSSNPLYHWVENTNDQFGNPEYTVWSLHQ